METVVYFIHHSDMKELLSDILSDLSSEEIELDAYLVLTEKGQMAFLVREYYSGATPFLFVCIEDSGVSVTEVESSIRLLIEGYSPYAYEYMECRSGS